jgi:hypothetical protein
MKHRQQRQQLVRAALAMTQGTTIAPTGYELLLLGQYIEGVLTLDQVLVLLRAVEQGSSL